MSKAVCKCCCEKCANRNIVQKKDIRIAFGLMGESYCCSNAQKVVFENHPKCETEIYCKNYKENQTK